MSTAEDTHCHSVCQGSARRSHRRLRCGSINTDGGVLLLADADRRLGLIGMLAALIPDDHDPAQITHLSDSLRDPVFAIACNYLDADNLDDL